MKGKIFVFSGQLLWCLPLECSKGFDTAVGEDLEGNPTHFSGIFLLKGAPSAEW